MTEGAERGAQGAGGSGSAASPAPRALPTAPLLFLLTFVTYAWFFNGGGWNQNAQFDLARALVERQTLHIDGYRVNTGDVSWSRASGVWHAYINKPPGVSFLAAVPYGIAYLIERALQLPIDSWQWMQLNAWIATVFTCALTGALLPVLLYLYGRRLGASSLASLGVALAIAFGTIAFPYATMLFAHVPSAFFLLLAFFWLDERPFLAGVAAGIAGACFYICMPAAAVLFLGARRNRLRFLLGGIPFGILLGVYHDVCFGSPFRTSVETSTNFTEEGLLFGVFRLPSLEALWGLTFSEYRGLFFLSPFLVLSVAGAFAMWRAGRRREVTMIAAIFAIFLLSIASFNGWHGGSAIGPRYILPAIPLAGIPLLFVRKRAVAGVAVLLGVAAFGMNFIVTAVDATPDGSIHNPITRYAIPRFLAGQVSINPQSIDELVPNHFYKPGSHEQTWASFNVGELAFGPARLSVLPVALWVLLGSGWLAMRSRSR